jgi:hypothetical protein
MTGFCNVRMQALSPKTNSPLHHELREVTKTGGVQLYCDGGAAFCFSTPF